MPELWDAYNADGSKIEGVSLVRGESIKEGLFHMICSIIVKHVDGTFLLMQRDFGKNFGGKWELSAGGAVQKGETMLQGAIRELKEETGIVCSKLQQLDVVVKKEFRGIFGHFLCVTSIDKKAIIIQKGETISYKWITKEELNRLPSSYFMSLVEREIVNNLKI